MGVEKVSRRSRGTVIETRRGTKALEASFSAWERGEEPFNVGRCKCIGETKKAIRVEGKFRDGSLDSMWCPKSVLHKKSRVRKEGDEGAWVVKAWWGEKNL